MCSRGCIVLHRDDTLGTDIETTNKIQEKRIYNNSILWDFHLGTYIDCELQDADEDSVRNTQTGCVGGCGDGDSMLGNGSGTAAAASPAATTVGEDDV